jgi:hypothetical protein
MAAQSERNLKMELRKTTTLKALRITMRQFRIQPVRSIRTQWRQKNNFTKPSEYLSLFKNFRHIAIKRKISNEDDNGIQLLLESPLLANKASLYYSLYSLFVFFLSLWQVVGVN